MRIRIDDYVRHKETKSEGWVRRINWSGQAEVLWFLHRGKYVGPMCSLEELEPVETVDTLFKKYESLYSSLVRTKQMKFGQRLKAAWKVLRGKVEIRNEG